MPFTSCDPSRERCGDGVCTGARENWANCPVDCESGTCGSCRTGLVAGEAEHRDLVLFPDEHATQIMVCVSRARGGELVLDL